MPSIRERKAANGARTFHVQVRMSGFPSRTASFPTKRQAVRWAKTIEADMIEGRHFRSVEARRRTLADAIDRYILEELPKKRSAGVARGYLMWWKSKLGHLKLSEITPAIIVEHRGKLGRETFTRAKPESKRSTVKDGKARRFNRTPSTINRFLAALSHVFTIARREWHWLSHNPMGGVSKLRENKSRVRFLSDDERVALLAETAKDATLHTLVVLALSTAARAGELLNLTWRDVDLKEGRLLFRITKNSTPRAVWLHGDALALLKAHSRIRQLATDRVFPNPSGRGRFDYAKAFKPAVKAAGIEDFRFHDLRHSAATYLARVGATEQQLRAIGGWKSGVVARYVHIAAQDAKDVIEKMNREVLGK